MTAKEMFKKLGYEQHIVNDELYYELREGNYCTNICFYLNDAKLCGRYITGSSSSELIVMSMDDLKAINKQCEELGWLENENI